MLGKKRSRGSKPLAGSNDATNYLEGNATHRVEAEVSVSEFRAQFLQAAPDDRFWRKADIP
ncbi:hypothetical protein RvVAR031_10700 [Agrobacterium vitis]|nr:hypothetical protein RvVAR031_10700 [Agrobacterium vitis]